MIMTKKPKTIADKLR